MPRRHAVHERIVSDVARHHGARAHERVRTDHRAAHDGRVRADGRAPPDERRSILVFPCHMTARIDDVRENAARPEEDVILDDDALVERHVVLYADSVAQRDLVRYEYVLAEGALPSDRCAAAHVYEVPDLAARPDARAVVDDRRLVNEHARMDPLSHRSSPPRQTRANALPLPAPAPPRAPSVHRRAAVLASEPLR